MIDVLADVCVVLVKISVRALGFDLAIISLFGQGRSGSAVDMLADVCMIVETVTSITLVVSLWSGVVDDISADTVVDVVPDTGVD